MKTAGSGVGRPSLGSRACRCRIAAPAAAASMACVAISSGVIGRASDMVGVWMLPVIAQEMITFPVFAVAIVVNPRDAQCGTLVSYLGDDPVFDRPYFVDLAPDGVADDQRLGRLESEADAARSSGENEIARLKGHGL